MLLFVINVVTVNNSQNLSFYQDLDLHRQTDNFFMLVSNFRTYNTSTSIKRRDFSLYAMRK